MRVVLQPQLLSMKQLNKLQTIVFALGGLLMVIGAGVSLTGWKGAPYVFTIGAACFTLMQLQQSYEGPSITLRRLRKIVILSDLLFLLSAVLMVASQDNLFHLPQITYVQYVYNKWIGTLLLAAIIQLYAIHRIDHELKRN